jgi:hypothetical protein
MKRDYKTVHLDHSYTEARLRGDGRVEVTQVGHTEGRKTHKIVLTTTLAGISNMAEEFHKVVRATQDEVDRTRKALKGED